MNDFKTRACELVSQMTLEEKASQMLHGAPAIPRLGIPSYNWWNEALHGVARAGLATVFPQAIGRAATFDPELEKKVGDAVSTEARAKYNLFQKRGNHSIYAGLTFWSPNVNMFRDPRWGRGQETFGEDPYLSGRMGTAYVQGLQGNDPQFLKTAACAKHFAVHSGPEGERHGFDARVSERDLHEYYLPAFKMLVQEGKVESVMTAYNRTNGEPCSASETLLQKILREAWGFDGHVMSDCGAIGDILNGHKCVSSPKEAAAVATKAGCDLCCGSFYSHLVEAVRSGLLTEEEIDKHVIRLMTTRMRLGLFEKPGTTPWEGLGEESIASAKHHALALRQAEESLVLVKNNGVLPLNRDRLKQLGVCGPLAYDESVLLGNYYGLSKHLTSCVPGIVAAAGGGIQVVYGRACGLLDTDVVPAWAWGQLGDIQASGNLQSDGEDLVPVVACIGLAPILEGEEGETIPPYCGDRTTLSIPSCQIKMLKELKKKGHPVIAVVFGGSPIELTEIFEASDAVLLAWYPGEAGGEAIGRTLFGLNNPSGRLPMTYPKSLEDLPPFRDYSLEGRTYRYATKEPFLPFGFGLSYTSYKYSNLELFSKDGVLCATVTVENTGACEGSEVVQVYVAPPEGADTMIKHRLAGFERVTLAAGEKKQVVVPISGDAFLFRDAAGEEKVPEGAFTVSIGGGQPGFAETLSAMLSSLAE